MGASSVFALAFQSPQRVFFGFWLPSWWVCVRCSVGRSNHLLASGLNWRRGYDRWSSFWCRRPCWMSRSYCGFSEVIRLCRRRHRGGGVSGVGKHDVNGDISRWASISGVYLAAPSGFYRAICRGIRGLLFFCLCRRRAAG
ncbi:hypothetical protein Rs2_47260 [Raphanus sativus]|nr:hypothetical protein Rs2_47260 [Raphanus sativus]